MDEGYDEIPTEDDRSIMAARLYFNIEVDGVATVFTGPLQPDDSGNWPTAVAPDVRLVKEGV
jgi:hypothetical protein